MKATMNPATMHSNHIYAIQPQPSIPKSHQMPTPQISNRINHGVNFVALHDPECPVNIAHRPNIAIRMNEVGI